MKPIKKLSTDYESNEGFISRKDNVWIEDELVNMINLLIDRLNALEARYESNKHPHPLELPEDQSK